MARKKTITKEQILSAAYEVAELIAKVTGFKGKIEHDLTKPNGSHRKVLDIKKIESIGWKPEISLEEGLKEIYKAMY